ncbi:NADPH:quinone dehydrogenase [Corynebacterium frankenforstense DSM 45800]|uniref:NADPH:quinone dehydrogenase n=1 Tax=Corynebacterium frankenforstense DSM 45800 TaxID=1437875 RepID=A0A1L7CQG6_9CORY|nr:MDR family oxidoreductase [Corynebacterium frankenforstense]APT88083.1 NADPH:quinone dehydrogenase [Corynebacterium frankenforstense DSM 45800]
MSHSPASPAHAVVVRELKQPAELTEVDLDAVEVADGDLLIDVAYSSLNYKDAMALAGDPGIVRTTPLIPGIDAVGTVVEAPGGGFRPGQTVVVNGAGLGERRDGGYVARTSVPATSAIVVPDRFDARQAAAVGTAGFTAALCVQALIDHGVTAGDAPVLVTGATGGVGSIALHLLDALGLDTVALTGRVDEHGDYLRGLGAGEILDRADFADQGKPLQKARFAGVVDTVGSHTLVNALAQLKWGGVAAACGMAQGPDLPGSVLPFILRGVTLVGANSVDAPAELRERAWALLARHLDTEILESLTEEIGLDEVIDAGGELLAGRRHGRTVVRVAD